MGFSRPVNGTDFCKVLQLLKVALSFNFMAKIAPIFLLKNAHLSFTTSFSGLYSRVPKSIQVRLLLESAAVRDLNAASFTFGRVMVAYVVEVVLEVV